MSYDILPCIHRRLSTCSFISFLPTIQDCKQSFQVRLMTRTSSNLAFCTVFTISPSPHWGIQIQTGNRCRSRSTSHSHSCLWHCYNKFQCKLEERHLNFSIGINYSLQDLILNSPTSDNMLFPSDCIRAGHLRLPLLSNLFSPLLFFYL